MNKIDYLQQQNKTLRQQIQDLKQILKLNKTQINILSQQQLKQADSNKLMQIIFSYREKQQKMLNNINVLKIQIGKLATDVILYFDRCFMQNLVLRQLNDGQNVQMKNMEGLNLSAVELLNKKIQQLEEKLIFYDKTHKQYDKVSGFVLKNREIVGPHQLALELKNREFQWEDQINCMKAQTQQYKKNQQNLMVVNTVLRNKIVSLQAQLAMPNRNLGQVLDKSLKKLMLYFIQVQKKIITNQQDSDSDQQNDLQLIAPELNGVFPQKQLRIQRDYGVPHLDLLKIRDQMNHASNKIKQALLARNHLTDKQKIQRLEIQLQYTRRQLSRNIIDLRGEKQKRRKAETIANQLQARMDLLIQSNQHLEAKVKKYWNKLKSQREKFYGMNQNLDTGKGIIDDEPMNNLDQTLILNEKILKEKQKASKKPAQNQFNPSLLLDQYAIDYKIHLQIMAKQLKNNKKLSKLQKLRPKPHIKPIQPQISQNLTGQQPQQPTVTLPTRMKRSTSNPLLYFQQRRHNIMQVHEDRQNRRGAGYKNNKNNNKKDQEIDQRQRLQQTCCNPGQIMGFQDVLQDFQDDL